MLCTGVPWCDGKRVELWDEWGDFISVYKRLAVRGQLTSVAKESDVDIVSNGCQPQGVCKQQTEDILS